MVDDGPNPTQSLLEEGERHQILQYASSNDWYQVVSIIHRVAEREQVPPGVILVEARSLTGANSLHYAAEAGHSNMAARLVHMVDTSITELTSRFINELNTRGETPLHWACRYGRFEVVRVLALWKPDYLLRNKKGLSAIALSWLRFDDDIVEFLRPLALYAGDKNLPPQTNGAPRSSLHRNWEQHPALGVA